jgi:hypothetical protein
MPKKLFLLDGLGAVSSAFIIGVIFIPFNEYIGLPKKVLLLLGIIPFCYAVYSLTCYLLKPKKWKFYLKIIAFLNFLYCVFILILILIFFDEITFLGMFYFIVEGIIISILIYFEIKKCLAKSNPTLKNE